MGLKLVYYEALLHFRSKMVYWCTALAIIYAASFTLYPYPNQYDLGYVVAVKVMLVFGMLYVFWMARLFCAERAYDTDSLIRTRPISGEAFYFARYAAACTLGVLILLTTTIIFLALNPDLWVWPAAGELFAFAIGYALPGLLFAVGWTFFWAAVWRNSWGVFLLGLIPWLFSDFLKYSVSFWPFLSPYLVTGTSVPYSLITGYGPFTSIIFANRWACLLLALVLAAAAALLMAARQRMAVSQLVTAGVVVAGVVLTASGISLGKGVLHVPTARAAITAQGASPSTWAGSLAHGKAPVPPRWERNQIVVDGRTFQLDAAPLDMSQMAMLAKTVAQHQKLFAWQWPKSATGNMIIAEVPGRMVVALNQQVVTVGEMMFRRFRGDDLRRAFIRRLDLTLWATQGRIYGRPALFGGIPVPPANNLDSNDPIRASFALLQDWIFYGTYHLDLHGERSQIAKLRKLSELHRAAKPGEPPSESDKSKKEADQISSFLISRGVSLWTGFDPFEMDGVAVLTQQKGWPPMSILKTAWKDPAFHQPQPVIPSNIGPVEGASRLLETLKARSGGDQP